MCRLFGLTAGTTRVRATFWLLDAPDSLAALIRLLGSLYDESGAVAVGTVLPIAGH